MTKTNHYLQKTLHLIFNINDPESIAQNNKDRKKDQK